MLGLLIVKTLNSLTEVQGRNLESKLRVRNRGSARIEDAKHPRFEGWARIERKARKRAGEGSWERLSESPENFLNFELQIIQSGV